MAAVPPWVCKQASLNKTEIISELCVGRGSAAQQGTLCLTRDLLPDTSSDCSLATSAFHAFAHVWSCHIMNKTIHGYVPTSVSVTEKAVSDCGAGCVDSYR